jgi:hypothetical protein
MLPARLLICARPVQIVPRDGEVLVISLLPKVLDVPVISFISRAPLTVGAAVSLHFQQGFPDCS